MPVIKQLDPHVADLIAAGEVVERPASVVKELMENAIDAGASAVTVEIAHGGMTLIRVTDNGCGIPAGQAATAFLRHATSKIATEYDLEAIGTLGFRGEALAAISAVSRVELLTRENGAPLGTSLRLEGGQVLEQEEAGCPGGTTMVVRDLFFNTPARLKFMKKDAAEGAAVFGNVQRLALSRPELSVKFIRDGKQELLTPGDGQLKSAVYAVLGRELALGFTEVKGSGDGMAVSGYVSLPACCRASRSYQHFFLNGRYIKSRTMMAALEEAYKNQKMVGKFPGCVLHLTMGTNAVDVNVHPAKTEVKFQNESQVFSAVYHAVLAALNGNAVRPRAVLPGQKAQDTVTPNQTSIPLRDPAALRPETGAKGTAGPSLPLRPGQTAPTYRPAPRSSMSAQAKPGTAPAPRTGPAPRFPSRFQRVTPLPPDRLSAQPLETESARVPAQAEEARGPFRAEAFAPQAVPAGPAPRPTAPPDPDAAPVRPAGTAAPAHSAGAADCAPAPDAQEKAAVNPSSPSPEDARPAVSPHSAPEALDPARSAAPSGTEAEGPEAPPDTERPPEPARQPEAEVQPAPAPGGWCIRGELFHTYVMVEQGEKIILIDKHAAHERANFDRLKAAGYQPMVQELLSPVAFTPPPEDRAALLEQLDLLARFGFEVEEFGSSALAVRSAPDYVDAEGVEDALLELAQRLRTAGSADPSAARDELLHTMACKAAIKGGQHTGQAELEEVAQMVMSGQVKYCPHGRPVAIELTKYQLEKQFKRA